jgi:hypothetical protein
LTLLVGSSETNQEFYPVEIIPPWLSTVVYHLGDEQQARWWPRFRDVSHSVDMNIVIKMHFDVDQILFTFDLQYVQLLFYFYTSA